MQAAKFAHFGRISHCCPFAPMLCAAASTDKFMLVEPRGIILISV